MKKHKPKFKIYGTRAKGRMKVFIPPFVLEPNRVYVNQNDLKQGPTPTFQNYYIENYTVKDL